MPADAIVFDLDGLMFNTEQVYAQVMQELLGRRQLPVTDALINQMMGRPGHVAFQVMIQHHQLPDTIAALQDESDEIFLALLEAQLAPMPGLMELLDALERAQIPKAIATSSRRPYVLRVLGRHALEPRFDFLLTAEDVLHGKPDPEIYLKAAAKHRLPPAQIVVLEDSQNGCRAAVAAGTQAIAVPGDHSRSHDFSGARFIAESLRDPRIFQTLGIS